MIMKCSRCTKTANPDEWVLSSEKENALSALGSGTCTGRQHFLDP